MRRLSEHSEVQAGFIRPAASQEFALGLGLTNECNLACAFCYRDPARVDRLSLDEVRSVMQRLPVRSVNLGTGENGMHPEFGKILAYLRELPVKLTITSNGHSAAVLSDDELTAFHDVEFSLDYADEQAQDARRSAPPALISRAVMAAARGAGASRTPCISRTSIARSFVERNNGSRFAWLGLSQESFPKAKAPVRQS